jgi:enamine deaminase RidA (YjgF/YER057c/UK114 family)
MAVVRAAEAKPEHIVRLVIYVTDKREYRDRTREVGERYRKHLGKHFPAMVLVEVKGLLDDSAKVEIEGMALIPA